MAKRRTAEQIKRLLKEADRELARGLTVSDVCRELGIVQGTYHRWRAEAAAAEAPEARELKELRAEAERLKILVAELMLDKAMLLEVAKKKW